MTTDRFQNKYRIPSARAQWHGYDGGAYYITICTKNREHYFGEIVGGAVCDRDVARRVSTTNGNTDEPEMQLSEIGKIATENFQNVSVHYPYAEIPLFVVMPNHIHAIVIIDGGKIPYDRGVGMRRDHVETRRATSLRTEQMTDIANMQGWLSVVIGGLKSAVTHSANEKNIEFAWQTRFHDRIVRDQNELNRIAEYIENNVANWHLDELNKNE